MGDLRKDVLLKGRIRIRAYMAPAGGPLAGLRVSIGACGFV